MNKLFIDTKDSKNSVIKIEKALEIFQEKGTRQTRTDITLPLIEKTLFKSKLDISEISEINVIEGSGSFTGVRIGVSIANALSFACLASINKKDFGNLATPYYQ